jgi:hypothetical protein
MNDNPQRHSTRVAIASALISLVLSIVFAAYIVGQRTGKVLEIEKWKNETAPRIERMDRQGSISFDYFKQQYEKEQGSQYARIQKVENEISHLDKMELRIERLEGKLGKDGNHNP